MPSIKASGKYRVLALILSVLMAQPSTILRILVPRLPLMVKTALWHSLSLSPECSKWDLRTELIINTLRSIMMASTSSISKQQYLSAKDPGVKGALWISDVIIPPPTEDDLRQLLFQVIDELKSSPEDQYTKPDCTPTEAEWTGFRSGVGNAEPEPADMDAATKFKNLMADTKSELTILYFHGGAFYLADPATHRPIVSKLCKLSGGRALSVRYRLAPQNPFPAAILDCLAAYLYLLYPPAGSFHSAVKPEHIVFAGDSAGGNVVFVLTQFLLHLHRASPDPTVSFNGTTVALPLPGAITGCSPWLDVTRAMPSLYLNAHYDYLPPPSMPFTPAANSDSIPTQASVHSHKLPNPYTANPTPCPIWPSSSPRADLYCDGSMLTHPLVSPLAVPSENWKGAPPTYICVGEEMLSDEVSVVTQRLAHADVSLCWDGYEAMPHVFNIILEGLEGSKVCTRHWAEWMANAAAGQFGVGGTWTKAKSLEVVDVDVTKLTTLSDDDVKARMEKEKERRQELFVKAFGGKSTKSGKGNGEARL